MPASTAVARSSPGTVPWNLGSERKIRPAASSDLLEGRPCIEELLALLPRLRVVVLLGRQAAKGWARLGLDLPSIAAPHSSRVNLNPRPDLRLLIVKALHDAARIAALT